MIGALVTGVGAIIGYGVARSLNDCCYPVRVIGCDIHADAVGQFRCDDFVRSVPVSEGGYPAFVNEIAERYSVDLVLPCIEQDVLRLARDPDAFAQTHATIALNDRKLVLLAHDKWRTLLRLQDGGIPTIETAVDGSYSQLSNALGTPFLVKPRRSYASKGLRVICTAEDLADAKRVMGDNFMAQEIVGDVDSEYTVGVFGLGDGSHAGSICFQRKLSGEGATSYARVVRNSDLDAMVNRLTDLFRPIGPTNYQFRLHKGVFLLLEVNPRISSSTSLRTAFGFNEAEMCIEYYLEGKKPAPRSIREGVAFRYIEDLVRYTGSSIRKGEI